jgi:hypothetical protein
LQRIVGFAELRLCFEAACDELVWCCSVEDTLPSGVRGGIEAARQLLGVAMRVDRDAQHFTADPTVGPFQSVVCRWFAIPCAVIFGTQLDTGHFEDGREETAIVGNAPTA